MGQYWDLINIDKNESPSSSGWGKLGEFFCSSTPHMIVEFLIVPLPPLIDKLIGGNPAVLTATQAESYDKKPTLTGLAIELLYIIFESIEHLPEAITLAITCKYLCVAGQKRILVLQTAISAPWAGDRLVCFGDYAKVHDLPPGVFTDAEVKTIKSKYSDEYGSYLPRPRKAKKPVEIDWKLLHRFSKPDSKMYQTLLKPRISNRESDGQLRGQWALCNLTKREYILRSTIDKYGTAGFGHFMLTRICWSSDSSASLCYDGDITRGSWAGDRFEITTTTRMKDVEGGWKDVGHEVGKVLAAIWEAEEGPNWREPKPQSQSSAYHSY